VRFVSTDDAVLFLRKVRSTERRCVVERSDLEPLMDYLADAPPELDDDLPMAQEALNVLDLAIETDPLEGHGWQITREAAVAIAWALDQLPANGVELSEGQRRLRDLVLA
jgi:hypothetical protein